MANAPGYRRATSIALLSFITIYTVAAVIIMIFVPRTADEISTSTDPGRNDTTGPGQSMVGIVEMKTPTADDRAQHAASLFNDYFSGINSGHYQQAAEVFDPALLDASQPDQVEAFGRGVSTTTDDNIVLQELRDDTSGKGTVEARVTFRSQQSAGFGPAGNPDETCTLWDVTYALNEPQPSNYRIAAVSLSYHTPC